MPPNRRGALAWLVALLATGGLVAVSGDLRSPFLPLLTLPAVVGSSFGLAPRWAVGVVGPQVLALLALWWRTAPGAGPAWQPVEDAVLLWSALGLAWVLALRLRGQLDVAEAEAHRVAQAVAKEETDRSRELELLASGVAHELKNPLTAVRSLTAHLATASDASASARALADEVRRLSATVDRFLSVTRPAAPAALLGAPATESSALEAEALVRFLRVAQRVVLALGLLVPWVLLPDPAERWRLVTALGWAALFGASLRWANAARGVAQATAPLLLFVAVHFLLSGAAEGPLRAAVVAPVVAVTLAVQRASLAARFAAGATVMVALGLAVHLLVPRAVAVPAVLDLARPEALRGLGGLAHVALTAWPMLATTLAFREGRRWLRAVEGRRIEGLERTAQLQRERWGAVERFLSEAVRGLGPQLEAVRVAAQAEASAVRGRTAERMGVVVQELTRMERLLADVQCLGRAPTADEVVALDLDPLLARLEPAWAALGVAKQVRVVARSTALRVRAEPLRLELVLGNLVRNAVEACEGRGEVRVSAAADGEGVLLRVEDDGGGLPDVALFTAGVTTKPAGNGLGLFISRRLVEQLGGALRLERRPERGCEAQVWLPAASPEPRAAVAAHALLEGEA